MSVDMVKLLERAEKAEAENARLLAALKDIAEGNIKFPDEWLRSKAVFQENFCAALQKHARAALTGRKA